MGEPAAARFTINEKPVTLDVVRLPVAEEPLDRLTEVELGAIEVLG